MANIGKIDKIIRIIGALVLFIASVFTPYWFLALFGIFLAVTVFFSFCPMYPVLGINTICEVKKDKKEEE